MTTCTTPKLVSSVKYVKVNGKSIGFPDEMTPEQMRAALMRFQPAEKPDFGSMAWEGVQILDKNLKSSSQKINEALEGKVSGLANQFAQQMNQSIQAVERSLSSKVSDVENTLRSLDSAIQVKIAEVEGKVPKEDKTITEAIKALKGAMSDLKSQNKLLVSLANEPEKAQHIRLRVKRSNVIVEGQEVPLIESVESY